jgi:hypothetical protein
VANYTKVVVKRATGLLSDGEVVRCAFLVKPSGAVPRSELEQLQGDVAEWAAPGDVTGALARRKGASLADSFPQREDVVLAVTSQRCLVFRQRYGLTAPRLDLLVEYPAQDVHRVGTGRGAVPKLVLTFADGSSVRMSIPRGQGDRRQVLDAVKLLGVQPS